MKLYIRSVTCNDAKGILEILNPIVETGKYSALAENLSEEEERNFINSFPERGVFILAESRDTGEIVGI